MKPETVVTVDGREVTLIHFLDSGGHIACMPNMLPKDMASNKERAAPHMRSDFAGAVTCPMCKKTKAWTEAKR